VSSLVAERHVRRLHGLCVSLTNAGGPCQTGNANYNRCTKVRTGSVDATVPAGPNCTNRQYILPAQTIGGLSVRRKSTSRRMTGTSAGQHLHEHHRGSHHLTTITSNNLGSDSNTRMVSSSSGDNVATVADRWVSTFQNYSGSTSSDPRIGHVLWGPAPPRPFSIINFVDGDDNPSGATPSPRGRADQDHPELRDRAGDEGSCQRGRRRPSRYGANAQQCLSATELSQVVNFAVRIWHRQEPPTAPRPSAAPRSATTSPASRMAGPGTAQTSRCQTGVRSHTPGLESDRRERP